MSAVGVDAIPARVRAWIDARAAHETAVRAVLADLVDHGPVEESRISATVLDPALAARLAAAPTDLTHVPSPGTTAREDA